MYASDTIAAIATPAGAGGVGIVRVSGPAARQIASRMFRARRNDGRWDSHRLYHGRIVGDAECLLDEGMAVLMFSPHSYTGEDVLELHCHGSPVVLRRVLAETLRCGARLAEPGEFTRRAFLNGRLDLAQAEAVLDLVTARSDAAADIALQQMSGKLSEDLAGVREDLIRLKVLLEAQIDFSEEDFEVDAAELADVTRRCEEALQALLATFDAGKVARDGLRVVLAGKPNVGKSSLLNALLGEDRAIVSAYPGTTRDTIEEATSFEGIAVLLTDTAGLRSGEHTGPVERLGIERTNTSMATAHMLLVVVDSSAPLDDDDRRALDMRVACPQLIIINKIDLPPAWRPEEIEELRDGRDLIRVSARTGAGLDVLRRKAAGLIEAAVLPGTTAVITRVRHRDALEKALVALRSCRASLAARQPADVLAVDVQEAIDRIGEITGAITNEDILDRIFSEFCIGK